MNFNPLTSKTIIGAVVVAIGMVAESGVLGQENKELIRSIATLVEAVGGVLFAYGVRHAIAKASQGIAQ